MKDCDGKEIREGDYVAIAPFATYGIRHGKAVQVTAKTVTVAVSDDGDTVMVRAPGRVWVLPRPEPRVEYHRVMPTFVYEPHTRIKRKRRPRKGRR
jgi:hypothetical protein